jgi:hypothetical protein
MTEAEWLACDNPWLMQAQLGDQHWSYRRLYLLTVACCRRWWINLPNPELKTCLDVIERFADNNASEDELLIAQKQLLARRERLTVFREAVGDYGILDILLPLEEPYDSLFTWDEKGFEVDDAAFLRCIQGNPFRLVAFSLEWRTNTALALARQMYDSRDFGAMPILADALQDAGCDNEDILAHCRGPGPHVRGCWVVDLVLGKE